jgi:rare lipoprotein A
VLALGAVVFFGCGGSPASGPRPVAELEVGRASYYADSLAGHATASGERYDPNAMTAAHRTLPLGTIVEVTQQDGRSVRVRVTDRGPYAADTKRIVDLSRRAAEELGILRVGVAEITLRVISLPKRKRGSRR